MKLFTATLAVLLVEASCFRLLPGIPAQDGSHPDFCHGLDCPSFTTVKNTSRYDIREYDSEKYVVTRMGGSTFPVAQTKLFARLYKYIDGANEDKIKMPMTTPVATVLLPHEDYKGTDNNYTMSFYLPAKFQGDAEPPKPTDPDVKVVTMPKETWYVRSFGGFALEGAALKEANNLRNDLHTDKIDFEDKFFLLGVYDGPTTVRNRHNEVGFKEREEDAAAGDVAAHEGANGHGVKVALEHGAAVAEGLPGAMQAAGRQVGHFIRGVVLALRQPWG